MQIAEEFRRYLHLCFNVLIIFKNLKQRATFFYLNQINCLKKFLGIIIKSVIDANNEHQNKNQLSMMSLSDNSLVSQYKDLIREQDMQIQRLNQANESLAKEKQELEVLY